MKLWQSQQSGSGGGSGGGDVYWGSILNKPSTFAPSSHSHLISDITNLQTTLNSKSDTTHNHDLFYRPISYVPSWSEIIDKPLTYSPAAHSHTLSNITDLSALTLDYSKLLNVPSSFNPAAHNHDSDYLKLSGGVISGSIIPQTHNTIDLGTDLVRFRDIWTEELHLSGNSLYLGDTKVLGTDASTVVIQTDPGQHLKLQTDTALLSLLTLGTNANINLTAGGTGSRIQISSTDSEINLAAVQTTITGDITAENNATVIGNLTVTGNLTVNGDNFSANVQTVNIEDAITVINHGEIGAGVTNRYSGVQVDRGTLTDFQFVYDEFDDFFKMGEINDLEIVASRDWCSAQFSALSHTHSISDITNLQTTLDGKALSTHSHSISDITNLQTTLSNKSDTTHNHDSAYRPISYVPSWSEITSKPSTFTPSTHSHAISEITNLQTSLDGKSATTHNHDAAYLALTGGTLSNSLTFSTPKLKYGNSLLVTALVIDSTKWYRVLSLDGNYCPNIELLIQIPLGHSIYRVRVSKGTAGNGMGWTAEVDCLGIYNYVTGNIIAVRVVDMGANGATYVDVKFNGNATKDIRLAIVSELANTAGNYATLVACSDQGTATAGVVSNLGLYDSATTIGVSKSYLSPWGKISTQISSTIITNRFQIGAHDVGFGIIDGAGVMSSRSNTPLCFYTNIIKRIEIAATDATTITLSGNANSDNVSLVFARVGVSPVYTQSIKFSYNTISQYVTDSLVPGQINIGLTLGYNDGSSATNSLVIGNGQVAINGAEITSGNAFQVNGSANITSALNFGSTTRQMINLWSTIYGIGIQGNTLYFRTGSIVSNFSFHAGGVHSDTATTPGAGGVEYMRVNNSGIYLDPANTASGTFWYRSYGASGWYNQTYAGGIYMTDTTWVRAYNNKGLAGYWLNGSTLAGTGTRAVYSDAVGTLTNTASDESLKTNIAPLTYGLNEVLQLAPVFYNWKDTEKMGTQKEIGLIAQQVQSIIPEVIGENFDGTLSLDYPKLVAVLINAIKELNDK
jgi:hypothetical protein